MSYIGIPPQANFSSGLLDRFTSTTGTTVTLTHDIASENDIVVFVNFVKQDSTTYSVGGTGNKTLTLGGTLVSSDIVEVHYLNIVGQTNAPSSGSVGSSQISADVITGQTALAVAPDSTDELLISDAGTLKRIDVSLVGGNNTPAFSAYANADQTGLTDNTWVKLAMNAEFYDTDSKYDVSSYRFTPTVSGKYVFGAEAYIDSSNTIDSIGLAFYKNGSKLFFVIENVDSTTANSISATIDLDSDDYVELYGYADVASSGTWNLNQDGTTSNNRVFWFGHKLIT